MRLPSSKIIIGAAALALSAGLAAAPITGPPPNSNPHGLQIHCGEPAQMMEYFKSEGYKPRGEGQHGHDGKTWLLVDDKENFLLAFEGQPTGTVVCAAGTGTNWRTLDDDDDIELSIAPPADCLTDEELAEGKLVMPGLWESPEIRMAIEILRCKDASASKPQPTRPIKLLGA